MTESAEEIVRRIKDGEEVGITIVQIAEITNLLESYLPLKNALKVEEFLLFDVTKKDCLKALEIAKEKDDAIAYVIIKKDGVDEIYSFDCNFDRLDVKRVT